MKEKITICSSMQFSNEIFIAAETLRQNNFEVLTPELSEKSISYNSFTTEQQRTEKRKFIDNHFQRIQQSSSILVLNYDKNNIKGYIGSNTLMEIGVAFAFGKMIYILNEPGEQACKEEVLALASIVLNGNLINILRPRN